MKWEYDSWNRIKNITYPDGEQVFYSYNRGGLLERMWGEKQSEHFEYVTGVKYNKFEAKTGIGYGNGTSAYYEYDILQRLSDLSSYTSEGELMQRVRYVYDHVNNITRMTNLGGTPGGLGGRYEYQYIYDDLYRLTNSEGGWDNGYNYSLKMEYAPDGKITRKAQSFEGNMGNDAYNYNYMYNNDQPHTIYKISNGQMFEWDKNANMTQHQNGKGFELRRLCWDEENRLSGVVDDKYTSFYYYDAGGERTVKLVGENQWMDVNGIPQGFSVINDPTLYSSAYLVASRKGYTKHYYIENQRITSKIGQGGLEQIREEVETGEKIPTLDKHRETTKQCMGLRQCEDQLIEYEDRSGWLVNLYKYREVLDNEKDLYFYHPDHLGSSSWITNAEGKPIQYLSYLPFGEEFVDQRTSDWSAAYKFTGKEKDEETGYNYFGARYYMSDLGIWASVDPRSDKYPYQTPYSYCGNRPINVIDPNGEDEWELNTVTGNFTKTGDRGGSEKDYYNISRPNEDGKFEVTQTAMIERSEGTINSFRIAETENSTTSAFHIPDADISGFFLEPKGPSTEKRNQNQRIPEGEYHLDRHNSKDFPNTFLVSNGKVSESRGILIHSGSIPRHTEGCLLPGASKSTDYVGGSRTKLNEIRDYMKDKNMFNVRLNIFNVINRTTTR